MTTDLPEPIETRTEWGVRWPEDGGVEVDSSAGPRVVKRWARPLLQGRHDVTPMQARILLCQITGIRWGEQTPRTMVLKARSWACTDHTRAKVEQAAQVLGVGGAQ